MCYLALFLAWAIDSCCFCKVKGTTCNLRTGEIHLSIYHQNSPGLKEMSCKVTVFGVIDRSTSPSITKTRPSCPQPYPYPYPYPYSYP